VRLRIKARCSINWRHRRASARASLARVGKERFALPSLSRGHTRSAGCSSGVAAGKGNNCIPRGAVKWSLRVNGSGVAERHNTRQALGVMATNLNLSSPDALLKIGDQAKGYYVELPARHQRGRPRTFSGQAFLLLAVVGVVLRTCKPQELYMLLSKDLPLQQGLGFARVPHRRAIERRLSATLSEAEARVRAP
jgi:hypothetical protein